jgi:hypothetical protein
MTALPRDDKPIEAFLDTMEIVSAWHRIHAQSKAGDIGRVRYREAIGIAIAKATNKNLRNELIRCHYNLMPEEALVEEVGELPCHVQTTMIAKEELLRSSVSDSRAEPGGANDSRKLCA